MWWRSSRDLGTEPEDTVGMQAADIGRSQIRSAEGNAGHVLQPRSRNRAQVLCPHLPARERLFHGIDMGRVRVFDDRVERLAVESQQTIADQAGYPHAPVLIECKSVGPASMTQRQHDLRRLEPSFLRDGESSEPSAECFDDVQPFTVRIRTALVCVVQSVGHDTGAMLVDEHYEPVGDVGTPGKLSGPAPRADGNPRSALAVDSHEICGRQGNTVNLDQPGSERAMLVEPPYSTCVPEIGEQERAVRIQGDAVGSKLDTGILREPRLLAAVRTDDRDASAPVGDEHVARGRTEHALRTMEALAEGLEGLRQGDGG